jgi:hypothetical protein
MNVAWEQAKLGAERSAERFRPENEQDDGQPYRSVGAMVYDLLTPVPGKISAAAGTSDELEAARLLYPEDIDARSRALVAQYAPPGAEKELARFLLALFNGIYSIAFAMENDSGFYSYVYFLQSNAALGKIFFSSVDAENYTLDNMLGSLAVLDGAQKREEIVGTTEETKSKLAEIAVALADLLDKLPENSPTARSPAADLATGVAYACLYHARQKLRVDEFRVQADESNATIAFGDGFRKLAALRKK